MGFHRAWKRFQNGDKGKRLSQIRLRGPISYDPRDLAANFPCIQKVILKYYKKSGNRRSE